MGRKMGREGGNRGGEISREGGNRVGEKWVGKGEIEGGGNGWGRGKWGGGKWGGGKIKNS